MTGKYQLGEKILLSIYSRWVGDYEIKATICGFEDYFMNGLPVYQVKTANGELLSGIEEKEMKKLTDE